MTIFEQELSTARAAYPQYSDKDDAFVLAMLASNRRHAIEYRNNLLKLNAYQASLIAKLEAKG